MQLTDAIGDKYYYIIKLTATSSAEGAYSIISLKRGSATRAVAATKKCFSWLRLWWRSWCKQLSSHRLGKSLDSLIVYEHLLVLKGPVYFVCFGSDEFPQSLFRFACLDSHVHIPYKIRLCTSSCLFDVYFSVFSSSL